MSEAAILLDDRPAGRVQTERRKSGGFPGGPLVLLIEDDPDAIEILSEWFDWNGFRVDAATTGLDGIHLAEDDHPDVIVLDMNLPDMDGMSVARRLQES